MLIGRKGEAVICDLGFSRVRHEVSRTRTIGNTTAYMRYLAPEVINGLDNDPEDATTPYRGRPTEASDLYALGMTCYGLGTFKTPLFKIKDSRDAVDAILRGKRPSRPESFGGLVGKNLTDVWQRMMMMWHHEPKKRIGIRVVAKYFSDLTTSLSVVEE